MTRPRLPVLTCVLALGAAAASAAPQDVPIPPRLSLADALRLADEHNPSLAVARQEEAIAAADRLAAARRPNPAFEAEFEGYHPDTPGGFWNGQEISLRFSQELEPGGRRGSRIRAASAGQAAANARLANAVRQVRREVGRAYFVLAGARAEADAASGALAEIDRAIAVSRARYEQGEISGGELRRLEVERLRFAEDVLAADLATRTTTSQLLALLGSASLSQPIEPVEGLEAPASTAPAADLRSLALAGRPDVAALRHERERAQAETALERALGTPAPAIVGGYKRDFGTDGLILGLSIPLPVFDRNQGGVARADALLRLADARLREAETTVAVEIQQALDSVEVSRRRVDTVERDYLSRAHEARDAVAAAYKVGEADLIDYLDAQRVFRDVQRAHTRALVELRLSLFDLQAAIGALPGEPRP